MLNGPILRFVGRCLGLTLLVVSAATLSFFSPRLAALPFALAILLTGSLWLVNPDRRRGGVVISHLAFAAVSLAPLDVRPRHWVGAPKVLPVLYGYPTENARREEEPGEIFLGGCVVSWNMPRWVLVW
jgi:hypothetical protein